MDIKSLDEALLLALNNYSLSFIDVGTVTISRDSNGCVDEIMLEGETRSGDDIGCILGHDTCKNFMGKMCYMGSESGWCRHPDDGWHLIECRNGEIK
jgi:hypothetical protein